MQLEDYFDFLAPNDIRLKGHRIGIETILLDYLDLGLFPEDIVLRYPSLNLEKVYATVTYYYRNQPKIDAYLQEYREYTERAYREQELNPSPAAKRLRELIRQREKSKSADPGYRVLA
ncbi:MAG TPA: DUF433 domain-containing protein [Anaerolineae bacterium]|nr:DUF433 domain-containing protein [Anaerolineae bacterium]